MKGGVYLHVCDNMKERGGYLLAVLVVVLIFGFGTQAMAATYGPTAPNIDSYYWQDTVSFPLDYSGYIGSNTPIATTNTQDDAAGSSKSPPPSGDEPYYFADPWSNNDGTVDDWVVFKSPATGATSGSTVSNAYLYFEGWSDGGYYQGNARIDIWLSPDGTNWTLVGSNQTWTIAAKDQAYATDATDALGLSAAYTVNNNGVDVTNALQTVVNDPAFTGDVYIKISWHCVNGNKDNGRAFYIDYLTLTFDYTGGCTDTTPSNLTITVPPANNSTVNGVVTITATADEAMSNMTVDVSGSTACDVTGAAMSGTGPYTYSWDTTSCGTVTPENPITITVSGNEPECNNLQTTSWNNITIDNRCSDPDPTTAVTVTPSSGSTVGGTVTVQATIVGESTPDAGSATVTITGSTACDVTGQAMTWNAGSGAFEYSWDTSACGNPAENPITISVDYTDPDCGDITNGTSNNITIDNTSPISSCTSCHGQPPAEGATRVRGAGIGGGQVIGSHAAHVTTHGLACTECHIDNGTPSDPYPQGLGHRNKIIEMVTIRGGSYVTTDPDTDGSGNPLQDIEDGSGLGNCTNTACHGASSDNWGTDLSSYDNCTICHGTKTTGADGSTITTNPELVAPPTAPSGDANKVGAHQAHLTAANGYSSAMACDECHTVPNQAQLMTHLDGLPAEVPLGGTLANANGATPAYNSGTLTCSGVYCHGSTLTGGADTTPVWNDANYLTGGGGDCGQCHGNPPNIPEHTGVSGNCNNCHSHNGTGSPADHIDGSVTYPNATCTSCHGQPPDGTTDPNVDGSHTAHFNTGYTDKIQDCDSPACHVKPTTMNHADGTIDYDSGICSSCHDSSVITASAKQSPNNNPNPTWGNGPVQCDWCHDNPPTGSTLYNHSGVNPGQCNSCHPHQATGNPTEHMDGTLQASGMTCSDCHGYPPTTGAHQVHTDNIQQSYEPNDGTWAWNPNDSLSNWNATNHEVCAVCHDMSNTNNHQDTTDHINPANWAFDNGAAPAYQGDFSCSNIKCHFGTSPAWK